MDKTIDIHTEFYWFGTFCNDLYLSSVPSTTCLTSRIDHENEKVPIVAKFFNPVSFFILVVDVVVIVDDKNDKIRLVFTRVDTQLGKYFSSINI